MLREITERQGVRTGGGARCALMLSAILLCAALVEAQELATVTKATTSRSARQDAIHSIPFRSLSPVAQRRIMAVVNKPTMYRRMPISVIDCDLELHRFVVRHPDVLVSVWQLMGITKVTAERVGEYMLRCSDGVGTTTSMELIYGDRDTHVMFCEGAYDGPLFRKPLTGRCVLLLKSGAVNSAGQYLIMNRLDVFLQVDHAGVDIFAKTLHPLLGKSADINFIESMRFLERMSQAAEINGNGMQHMIGRLQDLQPDIRSEFHQVVANVNHRYAQRTPTVEQATPQIRPQPTQPQSADRKPLTLRIR